MRLILLQNQMQKVFHQFYLLFIYYIYPFQKSVGGNSRLTDDKCRFYDRKVPWVITCVLNKVCNEMNLVRNLTLDSTLLHFVSLYYTLLHFITLYYTLLHFITLYCLQLFIFFVRLHSIILY